MFRSTAALFALALAATGCKHDVQVGYLQAADINVNQDIQTVLVIDRSRPRNAGEHVLNGLEGAASGEMYRLDADSAAFAIEALEDVLEDGPRFEVVSFNVNGRAVDTTMWDRQMTARKVRQLCRQAQCDAIIALETFDSDQFTEVERDGEVFTAAERAEARKNGDCEDRRCTGDFDYTATQHTDVTATFRMYDGKTGQVIDEQAATFFDTDSEYDTDNADEAVADLPFEGRVFTGAATLGAQYGSHISPHQVLARRNIFGGGSKPMRTARKAAKHGDLDTAEAIWTDIAQAGDTTLKAKAIHNLAVAAEARGDVGLALKRARRAARLGGKRTMTKYVATLLDRRANDAMVAEQMGETPELAKN